MRTLIAACRTPRGIAGCLLAGSVVLIAVLGPSLAPDSPTAFTTTPFAQPSSHDLLGGDALGRDVLSRVLDGGWVLLVMATVATIIGVGTGGAAGIAAAHRRGLTDELIMRTGDVLLAFPQLVFALLLVSVAGPKLWLITLAVGLSHAPQVARVMRAATLDVSEQDYVKAVELEGVRPVQVMTREVLPNVTSPLLVEVGLRFTFSIVIIAGLSFIGFGQQPPDPNWGIMINENRPGIQANPWAVVAPATLIAVLTVGINLITDALARVTIGVDRGADDRVLLEAVGVEPDGGLGRPDERAADMGVAR
jgi:peptide/nickel transport system permease protein